MKEAKWKNCRRLNYHQFYHLGNYHGYYFEESLSGMMFKMTFNREQQQQDNLALLLLLPLTWMMKLTFFLSSSTTLQIESNKINNINWIAKIKSSQKIIVWSSFSLLFIYLRLISSHLNIIIIIVTSLHWYWYDQMQK